VTHNSHKSGHHPPRLRHYLSRVTPDTFISLVLFATGLYAYTSTLAPTVIEGDAALFQYTPYVLGITYPTGFPLYILLGKMWVTIFPVGEIAWRMNLFSALCSAIALPLIYNATRRLFALPVAGGRWAALATVLIFATIPTFWRWSTEAKTYGLNILLFSGMLYTLALAITLSHARFKKEREAFRFILVRRLSQFPLAWPSLLLGLFISVHNTGILLIPGLLAIAGLYFRPYLRNAKSVIVHLVLLAIPGLFYLYIPLRAEWLIASSSRLEAIERGLLADFYHSGPNGLIRYFTGAGFTEGVVTNWGLVPEQFLTVYLPLFINDLTLLGVALGLIGGLALALTQFRLFLPLFLMYAVPIPFVIVYGQGEQSAFLLPSFLIFSFFAGNAIILINQLLTKLISLVQSLTLHPTSYAQRTLAAWAGPVRDLSQAKGAHHTSRFKLYTLHFTLPAVVLSLIPLLFLPQIRHNVTWLSIKWNRGIYNEWSDALSHPLESDAGMLAHWGDLTSFWYLQHTEGRRPDLRGVYPPNEATVINWHKRESNDLYIAGPLQGWAAGIEDRYQLIPWGRLVRIAPRQVDPQNLLPNLSQVVEVTFGNTLHLIGVDYPRQTTAGTDFPVTLTWQTLVELPPEATVSLRLTQNGITVAQLDDRLRSGWFPRQTLPADQHVLSYALLPVPLGILPGEYQLQLVTYTDVNQPWTWSDGTVVLDLGSVKIGPFSANQQPDLSQFKPLPSHDFDNELELVGYRYSVRRVGQGKGLAIRLLWQAKTTPADNYTLLVQELDSDGNVLRAVEHQPMSGRAPTGSWQAGQYIRDQVDLVVPASAPPGQDVLQVRLSWLQPNGSKLNLRRWSLPFDDGLNLGWLNVTEKKGRLFAAPTMQHLLKANLENKVRLLGYNLYPPNHTTPEFGEFRRSDCAANSDACKIDVEFYWQGINEMEQLYRVFLHVVDSHGQIVTQHDRVPGERGRQPTTAWLPGEVVTDPIELPLPADIATGFYTIRLGMYLPPVGPRLLVLNEAAEPVSDIIEVGTLEVTAQ
jgi:hypothetical protein